MWVQIGVQIQIKNPKSLKLRILLNCLLAHKDSNLECRYQKPVCCQLHHGPIAGANLKQSFNPANFLLKI